MANPLLHYNTFNSNFDALHSVVGFNYAETAAVAWESCKFGDGVRSNAAGYEEGNATGTFIVQNKGCAGIWTKPTLADGVLANNITFELWRDINNFILLQWQGGASQLNAFLWASGAQNNINYGTSWGANDLVHLAISWDSTHGTKKVMLFENGVEVATSNTAINFGGDFTAMRVCYSAAAAGKSPEVVNGNVKLWDYQKTDFSDREQPRAGLNDTIT